MRAVGGTAERIVADDVGEGERFVVTPAHTQMVLGTSEVAALIGWPTWKVNRWLKKTGAGEKRAGRLVTTLSRLIERFPEMAQACIEQTTARAMPEPQAGSASVESRLRLVLSRQDSGDARMRAVEAEVRRLRKEIRKLRRAFRESRIPVTEKAD